MEDSEEQNKKRWELTLLFVGFVLTTVSTILISHCSRKDEKNEIPHVINSSVVNNNPAIINNALRKTNEPPQPYRTEKEPKIVKAEEQKNNSKYVDIYLNINSGDVVLVNGKPPSADEISEIPNTLKLITGHRYTIKINNCPEKEITATKAMTISVCL